MQFYAQKLINNLPEHKFGKMNIILDGGAFSGSYILGALHYIRELELNDRMTVDKMSGCSIGSILCVLYKLNKLEFCHEVYQIIRDHFKENGNLHIIQTLLANIKDMMPDDFYNSCTDDIFLSYYDVKNKKHIIKSKFDSNDDIIETIYRSSYIPFICGEEFLRHNQFIDGLKPHDFEGEKSLFLNLCMNYQSLTGMLNIRNEVNNMERTIFGMLETHRFFTHKRSSMCFYTDEMNWMQRCLHMLRLYLIELVISIIYICYDITRLEWMSQFDMVITSIQYYVPKLLCTYNKCYMV